MNESSMDSQTYFELELKDVPAQQEEEISLFLFESGAAGVQENLQFEQKDKKYLPEVIEQDTKTLTAFFTQNPGQELLNKLTNRYPNIEVLLNQQPVKDWLGEWKAQWKPFCLVEPVWIVPDWEKENFSDTNKECIYIEPGMAFGTGTHATTQLASHFLVELKDKNLKSFVDVGTGSGILSILARKIGFQNGFAYDNDPESHRVFTENLKKNQISQVTWEENWPEKLVGRVDLLIANIIDGVLLELKQDFKKIEPKYCIFTGVLEERSKEFVKEMTEDWDLKLIEKDQKDEWVGFIFERRS